MGIVVATPGNSGASFNFTSRVENRRIWVQSRKPGYSRHEPLASVTISFTSGARTKRTTDWDIILNRDDFRQLAWEMLKADREEAMSAFARALDGDDPTPSEDLS